MKKAIVALALTVAALTGVQAQAAPVEGPQLTAWMQRPCPYEDSANCYWNAGSMGDGGGHSFFAHKINGDLCVTYVGVQYARTHDWCLSQISYDVGRRALIDMDGDGHGAEAS